jgi:cell division control protein 6
MGQEGNELNNIFDDNHVSIFKDEYPLSPKYIPARLVARDEQIEKIKTALKPIVRRGEPINTIIHGKTGTGKTVVVKFVVKQLLEKLDIIDDTNVIPIHINSKNDTSATQILYTIIKTLDSDRIVPKRGIELGWYYREIWELMNSKNVSILLIIDEIDKLKNDDILYTFSRAGGGHNLKERIYIGIIGMTNDTKYFENIDSRIKSSMALNNITFPPYNANQLVEILNDRAKLAFQDGVLEEMTIPLCSAFAAQEHGDARKALTLLYRAALIADEEHSLKIEERHVRMSQEQLDIDNQLEVVRTLPTQSKLVLLSILQKVETNNSKTTSGDIFNRYMELRGIVGISFLSRTRVSDLISELDMLGIIGAETKFKGRYGRTRTYNVPTSNTLKLKQAIYQDSRLKMIESYKEKAAPVLLSAFTPSQ